MKEARHAVRQGRTLRFVPFHNSLGIISLLPLSIGLLNLSCSTEGLRVSRDSGANRNYPVVPDGFVDRIEGEFAVIITDRQLTIDWPANGLKEGDVIRGGRVNRQESEELRERVQTLRVRQGVSDDAKDIDLFRDEGVN